MGTKLLKHSPGILAKLHHSIIESISITRKFIMSKAPKNIHDHTFQKLMSNRDFSVGFYQTYLPAELIKRIDFTGMKLFNVSGKVINEKDQKASQVDVVHSVPLDGNDLLLWTHLEHQSKAEKFMPLRVGHYQCGKLLEYAKLNKCDKVPPIITIIYHQGIKPYAYSMNLSQLFSDPALGMQYFAQPILVDLPATEDQDIQKHAYIGPAEMVLKYIRTQQFPHKYTGIIREIAVLDDKTRYTLIEYLIQRADIDELDLLQAILNELPQDKEIAMTVADQIAQRNLQEGMQQGMQQGIEQEKLNIAKSMLRSGEPDRKIIAYTGLSSEIVVKIKKGIH